MATVLRALRAAVTSGNVHAALDLIHANVEGYAEPTRIIAAQ
jgi:hypothetical protein